MAMGIRDEDLAGWSFEMSEISAGVYRVYGRDPSGRSIEVEGTDPQEILEECKKAAAEMVRQCAAPTSASVPGETF